jgi:hypothetical protein
VRSGHYSEPRDASVRDFVRRYRSWPG